MSCVNDAVRNGSQAGSQSNLPSAPARHTHTSLSHRHQHQHQTFNTCNTNTGRKQGGRKKGNKKDREEEKDRGAVDNRRGEERRGEEGDAEALKNNGRIGHAELSSWAHRRERERESTSE